MSNINEAPQAKRQSWSSRLAYILTVAGATIGFGATWRFPYLVGQNGGGAYVLLFVLAMILIGIPMILVENVVGRRLRVNSVDSFGGTANGKKINPAWKILGWMGLLGSFGILAYYMVIGGWVLRYIGSIISGDLALGSPVDAAYTSAYYTNAIEQSPGSIIFYTGLFVASNYFILAKGIVDGIERSVRFLMPLLFVFLIIMIIRNVTLPGAWEGVKFYLIPDFSKISPKLFVFVLGQVFFALSLGFGVLITLSSYLSKEENLVKTATITSVVNTLIALAAGLMIFPSLFTYGIEPNSGPKLVFQSLPIVFSNMPFGNIFAVIFFGLLIVAALTTSLTIYEVIITAVQEKTKMPRKWVIFWTLFLIFIIGNIPSALSNNVLSDVQIMGMSLFDAFDYISGNILFILTALGTAIFTGFVLGDEAKKELNVGKTFNNIWFVYVKYFIPVLILIILFYS